MTFPTPSKLLDRILSTDTGPLTIAMCPDFESGSWRYLHLANHIFDWLPDVALRPDERTAMLYEPNKQLARSCRRLFDTSDPNRRGEIGEILIHAICRQEFGTVPFVARLFYKMRTNDSVTSVDVVHLLHKPETDDFQLWLGEAKLYRSLNRAKSATFQSIQPLWDPDFLQEMKALIGPKIESGQPYSEALTWLFADETSLDNIVSRIVVPVCIACDYNPTKKAKTRTSEYLETVKEELLRLQNYFKTRVPIEVTFVCIFVPMDSKSKLETAVNDKVQSFL